MSLLKLEDVRLKINGKEILKGITAELEREKVYAFVGPNGAGKSTLAYTIMGLDEYRNIEGDIIFEGESIKGLAIDERARKGITLAWQEPARYEGLSVAKFILAAARRKSLDIARDALLAVGLEPEEYLHRALDKSLSGGERKKIELASILAMEAKLVILDEPDSGIDVASLQNIFDAIKFMKERGSTILLITHSPVVLRQAEYAFLMCSGMIVEEGKMEDIVPYFEGKCIPCRHKNMPDMEEDKDGC